MCNNNITDKRKINKERESHRPAWLPEAFVDLKKKKKRKEEPAMGRLSNYASFKPWYLTCFALCGCVLGNTLSPKAKGQVFPLLGCAVPEE